MATKATKPLLSLPVKLGEAPSLQSRADLEKAIEALAWLSATRRAVHAKRDAAVLRAGKRAVEELRLKVGRTVTDVEAFEAVLRAAVEDYTRTAPPEFEGVRTLRLAHGSVLLRKNGDRVEVVGEKAAYVAGVTDKIKAGVETLLRTLGLLPFVRLKVEPDIDAIKAALGRDELTREQLPAAGFQYVVGSDRVEIELKGEE